jgi:hypothetical protein
MITFILVLAALFLILDILGNKIDKGSKAVCKQHKWFYPPNGWMECSVCGLNTKTSLDDKSKNDG